MEKRRARIDKERLTEIIGTAENVLGRTCENKATK
jgi:hypothetical protein